MSSYACLVSLNDIFCTYTPHMCRIQNQQIVWRQNINFSDAWGKSLSDNMKEWLQQFFYVLLLCAHFYLEQGANGMFHCCQYVCVVVLFNGNAEKYIVTIWFSSEWGYLLWYTTEFFESRNFWFKLNHEGVWHLLTYFPIFPTHIVVNIRSNATDHIFVFKYPKE